MEEVIWKEQPLAESSFWVLVDCEDKQGVLADITRVISDMGLSVSKHWGHRRAKGDFVMKYDVHDPGGKNAKELSRAIEAVEGCKQVKMGCTLPNLAAGPQFWLRP